MLSIVIPALNAAETLPATLASLKEAPGGSEIVIADGGSADDTAARARTAGARVVESPRGRGRQLAAGAEAAAGDWLLFLHADTALAPGWAGAAADFMADPANANRAGYFRFALDDDRRRARRVERLVAWRCRRLGLPYGDQGLLIARDFYQALGGFQPLPIMEDVALARRIGRRRLAALAPRAVTSAERYKKSGYLLRPARNLACLALYFLGLPPRLIARLYA